MTSKIRQYFVLRMSYYPENARFEIADPPCKASSDDEPGLLTCNARVSFIVISRISDNETPKCSMESSGQRITNIGFS